MFIYFDLGNVLLHFDHRRAARQIGEVVGLDDHLVWETVFEGQLQWRYERGELTSEEFCQQLFARTGTQADINLLLTAAADIFELNAEIVSVIEQLHATGYRLGILSNTNAAHWGFVTDGRYPLLSQFFEIHVLSFEVRSMKPEPAIYAAALRRCGLPAQQVFFVDDREENVAGARAAGIDAVLYRDVPTLKRELQRRRLLL